VRRNARGSLAELFGAIDSSTIARQAEPHPLLHRHRAPGAVSVAPRWIRDGIDNFVAGLNAYVDRAYATPASRAQLVPFQFWTIGLLRGQEVYKPMPSPTE
jgi:acyl-homoserine lactone acylase PvdQ